MEPSRRTFSARGGGGGGGRGLGGAFAPIAPPLPTRLMKDLENVKVSQPAVSLSANCLLVMSISKQNMEEFVFAYTKENCRGF